MELEMEHNLKKKIITSILWLGASDTFLFIILILILVLDSFWTRSGPVLVYLQGFRT